VCRAGALEDDQSTPGRSVVSEMLRRPGAFGKLRRPGAFGKLTSRARPRRR
jgi:hypothetical protein